MPSTAPAFKKCEGESKTATVDASTASHQPEEVQRGSSGPWSEFGGDCSHEELDTYVASVERTTKPLTPSRVPLAEYLAQIHALLHPIFAVNYLGSLDALPQSDPRNDRNLETHLEIVLSARDGSIVKMGVTRASGQKGFDNGALAAVGRASPFGSAPAVIASADGSVYLHWEFHRHPVPACSTYFARVYMLASPPAIGSTAP